MSAVYRVFTKSPVCAEWSSILWCTGWHKFKSIQYGYAYCSIWWWNSCYKRSWLENAVWRYCVFTSCCPLTVILWLWVKHVTVHLTAMLFYRWEHNGGNRLCECVPPGVRHFYLPTQFRYRWCWSDQRGTTNILHVNNTYNPMIFNERSELLQ